MTDDPMQIIENYLRLVRSHLPAEAADDIIDELRNYVVDAADELGNGHITVQSAKRVVAQLGAPSEVALEYADAVATARAAQRVGLLSADESQSDADELFLEEQHLVSVDHGMEGLHGVGTEIEKLEVGEGGTLLLTPEKERDLTKAVSYRRTAVRVLPVTGFLLLLTCPIPNPYLITMALIELPLALAIVYCRLVQLKLRGVELVQEKDGSPSAFRRFFNLPKNLEPTMPRAIAGLDPEFSFTIALVLLAGALLELLEPFSSLCAAAIMGSRFSLVFWQDSHGERGTTRRRAAFVSRLLGVMNLNTAAAVSMLLMYHPYNYHYAGTPLILIIAFLVGSCYLALSTLQTNHLRPGS